MNDKINKMRVMFAQGEREIEAAAKYIEEGNHGKVRTISRRAAGYYISGLRIIYPKKNYGMSFMNNLRAIQSDMDVPDAIRTYAEKLIAHTNTAQISGKEAVECAEEIIYFCKEKAAAFVN